MKHPDPVILFVLAILALVAGAMTLAHIHQASMVKAAAAEEALAEENIVGWVHLDPETAQLVYVGKVGR